MASTLTNLIIHVVFSTKERARFLTEEVRPKAIAYIIGILRGEGAQPIQQGGVADHLHLLAKLPATVSLSDMMQRVKGKSSYWINEQGWLSQPFSWQRGYAAFSVSQSQLSRVAKYIAEQDQHHHKTSFQEELISLLVKHKVDYDEKYLWT